MGIAGVMKNIGRYGVTGTYHIYRKRRHEKEQKEFSRKENIQLDRELNRRIQEKYPEEDRTAAYGRELKSLFVKEIYPRIYAEESGKPIERKAVFMERGASVSPSLKYMIRYVRANTDYEVKVFALGFREVSNEQYFKNAKDYIREAATAKALFVCTANDLMSYFKLRPETVYIQLWHGCGSFKKLGLSTVNYKFGKSAKGHKEYPANTNYSYVTIASPEHAWIFEESMGIDKESGIIAATGISRTDVFFEQEFTDRCYRKFYEMLPAAKNKKVLLYAPTFRGRTGTCVSPDRLDIGAFAEKLSEKYILIIKHHQMVKSLPEIPEPYRNSFAYDMSRIRDMDINELMTVADICISDYSSVVFEYSLFERPILFYTFDIDEYTKERGLYYDFEKIAPGPLFQTNEEMIDYILHLEDRFDRQKVIDFKNKFMCCCDGHSSERIWALVEGEKKK